MIAGVGIDMIEVARVLEKINKPHGFRERIFSANEIEYCESKTNKGEHYAGRFAAKEAFLKATGLGLTAGFSLAEIEVHSGENGSPEIVLSGNYKTLAIANAWTLIHVSISHLSQYATAIVILEK